MTTKKVGIWIDREHAIVDVNNAGQELKFFHTSASEPFPQTTESRAEHSYTRNDTVPEDRLERKQDSDRFKMYDAVLQFIGKVDSLYVIGPGEAKKEFQKHLNAKGLSKVDIELETSDKMTDPQFSAKVREHFKA